MNNMGAIINQLQGLLKNPAQAFAQMRLPQGALQNPQATVQQMVASGQMSQEQFNKLRQMAEQIQSNPAFAKMFQK